MLLIVSIVALEVDHLCHAEVVLGQHWACSSELGVEDVEIIRADKTVPVLVE